MTPTIELVRQVNKESEDFQLNSNENSNYHFIKKDITLIKECDKLCDEIVSKKDKINLLFMSSGFLTLNGRTENVEGLDTKMSVNYYGRWRIVERLMPLIKKAGDNNESAMVVSVLSSGNEEPVQEDDLDLKHKFSLANAFRHAYPGGVNTGILRGLPWFLRISATVFLPFITTGETSGEKFYYMAYSSPDFGKGSFYCRCKV